MQLMHVLMFAGIFSLYIGFSAVQGYLLRSVQGPSYRSAGGLIISAYALLIWAPTSAFILMLSWIAFGLRVISVLAGMATIALVILRPEWMPALVWTRTFNRRYLGATMILVALAALIPWFPNPNIGALTLGLAACIAGISALRDLTARA
ncbi:MAG: hypothetical protein PVG02_06195 [Anaerolineales bacterium]